MRDRVMGSLTRPAAAINWLVKYVMTAESLYACFGDRLLFVTLLTCVQQQIYVIVGHKTIEKIGQVCLVITLVRHVELTVFVRNTQILHHNFVISVFRKKLDLSKKQLNYTALMVVDKL